MVPARRSRPRTSPSPRAAATTSARRTLPLESLRRTEEARRFQEVRLRPTGRPLMPLSLSMAAASPSAAELTVLTTGAGSFGLFVNGAGSSLTATDVSVTTSGGIEPTFNAPAIGAYNGSASPGDPTGGVMTLIDTTIATTGVGRDWRRNQQRRRHQHQRRLGQHRRPGRARAVCHRRRLDHYPERRRPRSRPRAPGRSASTRRSAA